MDKDLTKCLMSDRSPSVEGEFWEIVHIYYPPVDFIILF